MATSSKLEAALAMAARRYAVFPLVANGKTPAISNWQNLATTDPDTILNWWSTAPDANIGHPTVNEVIIDIDPRKGGCETFEALTLTEDFPRTSIVETQSKGNHVYYALPPHTVVKGGTDLLGQGVDVKSWGGYVVAPGSTIDGRPYRWMNERPTATAPQWLIDRCNQRRARNESAGERLVAEDDSAVHMAQAWLDKHAPDATEGERDDTAFKVAARLYDYGVSEPTAHDMLTEWSELHAFPPLSPEDLARIAGSAGRNRDNAIGVRHPDASGFEPVDISQSQNTTKPTIQRKGLYFLNAEDAAARALTHNAEPLIDGFLDCGTMSVKYGESNNGKSFSEMDLDYHIARGEPWAGRAVKQGAVVWVAAEGGAGIYKRVAALRNKYGPAPFYIVPCPVNLLRADADVGPLIALIHEVAKVSGQKVVKITIDTLSRVIAGGDENSSVDMGRLVHHFDAIREATGAHLAVIHHTGKDKAKGARGHSLLRAATDTEIEVDGKTITATKQRDLDGEVAIRFRLVPVRVGVDARGKEVTSCWVDTGADVQVEVDMTGAERSVFFAIVEGLHNTTKTEFQTSDVVAWCRKFAPDTASGRTTISEHLSALSEKRWIEPSLSKNKYIRGCRKVSEGVGSSKDLVSEFFGCLESRKHPTVPTEQIVEEEGFSLAALADYRRTQVRGA